MYEQSSSVIVKRPSHGKLKLANSCWQTQVGVCERHKNSRRTRFYLTPTVCKCVCRLVLCRSHTPTWVCQHEFANLSLPCEGYLRFEILLRLSRRGNISGPWSNGSQLGLEGGLRDPETSPLIMGLPHLPQKNSLIFSLIFSYCRRNVPWKGRH